MISRRGEKSLGKDPLAEIVAIGVLPEFLTPKFVRLSGHKISEELIKYAASYFRSLNLNKMRLVFDSDNKSALLFYHSLGAKLESYELAGKPSILAWFDLSNDLK